LFNHADSTRPERRFVIWLTDRSAGAQLSQWSDTALVTLDPPAESYEVRASCLGCSPADTTLAFVPGRVDTADIYLTVFPVVCDPPVDDLDT